MKGARGPRVRGREHTMDFKSVLSDKRIPVPTPDNVVDEYGNCRFGTFESEFPKMDFLKTNRPSSLPNAFNKAKLTLWEATEINFDKVVLLTAVCDMALFGTVLTVLLKGSLAGFVSGILYRALSAKSKTFAGILAAFSCPVVNTGVFLLGCIVFFMPTVTAWGTAMGFENVWRYMIFGLVGGNFLFEMLVNIILCPVILRLIQIAQKRRA